MILGSALMWVAMAATVGDQDERSPDASPDAFVFVEWAGLDALDETPATHLAQWMGPDHRAGLEAAIQHAVTEVCRAEGEDVLAVWERARPLASACLRHPTTLFVGPIVMGFPRFALLCDAGEESDAVAAQTKELLALLEQPTVRVSAKDGRVTVRSLNLTRADQVWLGMRDGDAEDGLRADASMAATVAGFDGESFLTAHVSLSPLVTLIDQLIGVRGPNMGGKEAQLFELTGLRALDSFSVVSGPSQAAWATRATLAFLEPPSGLLSAFGKPMRAAFDARVPRDATMVMSGALDAVMLRERLLDVMELAEPGARETVTADMLEASLAAGIDFERDVYDALGVDWCAYTSPSVAGPGLPGAVILHQPKDAPRLEASVDALVTAVNDLLPPSAPYHLVRSSDEHGPTTYTLSAPFLAPTVTFVDGWMIGGLLPAVVSAAAELEGELFSQELPAWRAAGIGQGRPPTAQVSVDLPSRVDLAYGGGMLLGQSVVGFLALLGADVPLGVVPTLPTLRGHLEPATLAVTSDERSWTMEAREPFPLSLWPALGAEIVGSTGMYTAIVGAGVALLESRLFDDVVMEAGQARAAAAEGDDR